MFFLKTHSCLEEFLDVGTKEAAQKMRKDMEDHSLLQGSKIHLTDAIATSTYKTLRTWSRQCGFFKQQDFSEDVAGFKPFLRIRLDASFREFSGEDVAQMGSIDNIIEHVKIHMSTDQKITAKNLLQQKPRKNEAHAEVESLPSNHTTTSGLRRPLRTAAFLCSRVRRRTKMGELFVQTCNLCQEHHSL